MKQQDPRRYRVLLGLGQDISWVIQEARERGLSQYRLTFPQTTNRDAANDLAVLVPERQRLALSYLIP